jgi:hypothetical protein
VDFADTNWRARFFAAKSQAALRVMADECRPLVAGEVAGDVTAAIVGQPLDGDRQAIDQSEAMLDGSEHQITDVLTANPTCGSEETHGLAITAIECEGDPHPLTVVAANLKAVGAPAAVAFIDGDASVMSPLDAAGMLE